MLPCIDEEDDEEDGDSSEEEEEAKPAKKDSKKEPKKESKKEPKKESKKPAPEQEEGSTLDRILKMQNTPKKEKKFLNFCKNTFKITDEAEIGGLWDGYKKAKGL